MAAQRIGHVALVVRDYDEAKRWYCDLLGFVVIEDVPLAGNKRWVVIAPAGSPGPSLVLGRASTEAQLLRVGDQTGGRVFLFLHTDDFWRDFQKMQQLGVRFCEDPREESYGTVVVFEDLYGNRWDLLQLKPGGPSDEAGGAGARL